MHTKHKALHFPTGLFTTNGIMKLLSNCLVEIVKYPYAMAYFRKIESDLHLLNGYVMIVKGGE